MPLNNNPYAGLPPACAACRHQRKKCSQNCEMAQYFPSSRYQDFQNAQRIFGVSNIIKLMHSVEPHLKQATAESILTEGNVWCESSRGCLGIIEDLSRRIQHCERELDAVNHQLTVVKTSDQHLSKKKQLEIQKHLITLLRANNPVSHPTGNEEGGESSNKDGYNYQSTVEEGEDLELYDLQSLGPSIETYQTEQVLAFLNEADKQSSVNSMAQEKQQEAAENEAGPSDEKGRRRRKSNRKD